MEIIFIIILLIILTVIGYDRYIDDSDNIYDTNIPITSNSDCICAFDLDHTISCNEDNARKVIDVCKKNNCVIAINTARPILYYNDIRLSELGLEHNDFINDFYYGSYSNMISAENIARQKIVHMNTLINKYKVLSKRAILFDDNTLNIQRAREEGFSVVLADDALCGLKENAYLDCKKILNEVV